MEWSGVSSAYDVTDCLHEIKCIGMDILTVDVIVKKIMLWMKKNPYHDFPKKTHRWKKLIETQYLYYFPTEQEYHAYFSNDCYADDEGRPYWWSITTDGRLFVRANISKVLRTLVNQSILYQSAHGKRLKINRFKVTMGRA